MSDPVQSTRAGSPDASEPPEAEPPRYPAGKKAERPLESEGSQPSRVGPPPSPSSSPNSVGPSVPAPESEPAMPNAAVPATPTPARRAPSRPPAVEAVSLTKRFGSLVAVEGVSFTLEPGTVTGFLGPNGAGKTTTLRMLVGLAQPTAGEAFVFGRRYQDLEDPMQKVGAVLESGDFDPGRSGRNHLHALRLATGVAYSRVQELLELVELEAAADRPVRTYSLGMRQRLGLAAALLGDPELLLLDEPANGLDPAGVAWLRGFLRRFAARGRTVLVSSHVLAEIARTVDVALIIDHGRLVATVRLDELTDGARSLEDLYLAITAKGSV